MSLPVGKPQTFLYTLILLAGLILAWVIYSLQSGNPVETASGPDLTPVTRGTQPAARFGSDQVRLGRLTAPVPPGWSMETPSSSMRLAQFRLPAGEAGQEDAELAVFSGIGGGTRDILNRWFGQFVQPDGSSSQDRARVETMTLEDIRVTLADLTGTFTGSGMPMTQAVNKPGYRLLAAIVESFDETYYFKLVGPEPTVGRWAESFSTFIGNLRYAGP
ncbi:MAG: hypothetical protein ACE5HZ_07710 [Fidelibacterota bacterium]